MQKRICTVNDISSFGRCSITTAVPVISAAGHQCCPVPSAVLSAHTAYPHYYFKDLTDTLPHFCETFEKLNVTFDALYSGYLGSTEQIEYVTRIADNCLVPGGLLIVDPVMGDNGVPYTMAVDSNFSSAMSSLCARADIITPNFTEAALLLGIPFSEIRYDEASVLELMRGLAEKGSRVIVITGMKKDGMIGAGYFCRDTGEYGFTYHREIPVYFPGTGDLFASLLVGLLLKNGLSETGRSVAACCEFISECAAITVEAGTPTIDGVQFERLLYKVREL